MNHYVASVFLNFKKETKFLVLPSLSIAIFSLHFFLSFFLVDSFPSISPFPSSVSSTSHFLSLPPPHPSFLSTVVSFWAHSRKELRPSSHAADMYDQPSEASAWLSNFRTINANILKSVRPTNIVSLPQKNSRYSIDTLPKCPHSISLLLSSPL